MEICTHHISCPNEISTPQICVPTLVSLSLYPSTRHLGFLPINQKLPTFRHKPHSVWNQSPSPLAFPTVHFVSLAVSVCPQMPACSWQPVSLWPTVPCNSGHLPQSPWAHNFLVAVFLIVTFSSCSATCGSFFLSICALGLVLFLSLN